MYGFHAVLPRNGRTREKVTDLETKITLFSKALQLNGKLKYIKTDDAINLVSPLAADGPFKPTKDDKIDENGY